MGIDNINFDDSVVAVSSSASEVAGTNSRRDYLFVRNQPSSSGKVYIKFNGDATIGGGIELSPGDYYEPLKVPSNSISAISDSSANLVIIEG